MEDDREQPRNAEHGRDKSAQVLHDFYFPTKIYR
jgi:hypothetical protein